MSPQSQHELTAEVVEKLRVYGQRHLFSGIAEETMLVCLAQQIKDSVRRIRYIDAINARKHDETVKDPLSEAFDPYKAAVLCLKQGNLDEACWLIFLATHFGKHLKTKWKLFQAVYGAVDLSHFWDWEHVSQDIEGFKAWLIQNEEGIVKSGSYGNHRKYESAKASANRGIGGVVESYLTWVGASRSHAQKIELERAGSSPRESFARLYFSMRNLTSFGRTAKFDYLTMIGKLGLAPIEPGSLFLDGATGPLSGVGLLLGHEVKRAEQISRAEKALNKLESYLGYKFGMQVLEDALCNWQKSPDSYQRFRG